MKSTQFAWNCDVQDHELELYFNKRVNILVDNTGIESPDDFPQS